MDNRKSTYRFILTLFSLVFVLWGCKDDDDFGMDLDLDKAVKITDFQVEDALAIDISEEDKTIVITYAGGTDVSNIIPEIVTSEGANISPASGTPINLRSPQTYTVKNGNLFSEYRVVANVLSVTAFLSHHSSVNDIQDDDEAALAEWFFSNYSEDVSAFVSFQDIKDGNVDLSQYKTLMWYLDGDANEQFTMPEIAQDPEVIGQISDWYKTGGNLYLMGYANQYLFDLDRITRDYFLTVGTGPGFQNPDTWGVNVNINRKNDQSGHPIFADIDFTTQGDGRKTFPVISPGWKEDRNYVLVRIPETYGVPNDSDQAYTLFIEENNAKWLATWDGIGDYFMAGIIEFSPTAEFQGTAIFQGLAAIEWNQNALGDLNPEGINANQENIEKLTENTINFLSVN